MNTKTAPAPKATTAPAAAATAESAGSPVTKISTFDGAQRWIKTAIDKQSDVEIVSMTVEDLDKTVGEGDKSKRLRGKRIRLELKGAGIDDPTRRYFLRNNSQFASGAEAVGLHLHAPKKERNTTTYTMFLGMDKEVVSYEPPAPPKAEKKLLSADERKERRLAGKQAKRAERAAAAAAAAEAGESAPAVEAAKTIETTSAKTDVKEKASA